MHQSAEQYKHDVDVSSLLVSGRVAVAFTVFVFFVFSSVFLHFPPLCFLSSFSIDFFALSAFFNVLASRTAFIGDAVKTSDLLHFLRRFLSVSAATVGLGDSSRTEYRFFSPRSHCDRCRFSYVRCFWFCPAGVGEGFCCCSCADCFHFHH